MTTSAEIISEMNPVAKTNQRLWLLKFIKIKTNISSRLSLLNWIFWGFWDKEVTSASVFLHSSLTIMSSIVSWSTETHLKKNKKHNFHVNPLKTVKGKSGASFPDKHASILIHERIHSARVNKHLKVQGNNLSLRSSMYATLHSYAEGARRAFILRWPSLSTLPLAKA